MSFVWQFYKVKKPSGLKYKAGMGVSMISIGYSEGAINVSKLGLDQDSIKNLSTSEISIHISFPDVGKTETFVLHYRNNSLVVKDDDKSKFLRIYNPEPDKVHKIVFNLTIDSSDDDIANLVIFGSENSVKGSFMYSNESEPAFSFNRYSNFSYDVKDFYKFTQKWFFSFRGEMVFIGEVQRWTT